LPEDHPVHFIIEAVEKLDASGFKVNGAGGGSERRPPDMTGMSPPYCQSTGRVSSRMVEAAAYTDVAARCIRRNKAHSEHSVICRFRTGNRQGVKDTRERGRARRGELQA
ncbi:MAG: hypothetical protein LBF60_05590, partial [Treponema sp.]|nr:hypothetical protein [Treponema sp.]